MTTKKLAYISYYTLAASILIAQVAFTLYQGSLTVTHGRTMKNLQSQKNELAMQRQQLQAKVASQLSLNQLTADQLADYQVISSPLLVKTSDSLAAVR